MLLQLFVDNTRLALQKRLWILCFSTTSIKIWTSGAFFTFSLFIHLSEPRALRKQKVVVRDLWLVHFDQFCVFLCFKIRCFVFEKQCANRKFYLSSKIFFIFFTLKHGKFRFQKWNCSYRASKRTSTFPLLFTFADKHSGCYGNGLIDVTEKFEFGACSIWIVEDVGRGSYGVHLRTKITENKRQFEVQKFDYPRRNLVIYEFEITMNAVEIASF